MTKLISCATKFLILLITEWVWGFKAGKLCVSLLKMLKRGKKKNSVWIAFKRQKIHHKAYLKNNFAPRGTPRLCVAPVRNAFADRLLNSVLNVQNVPILFLRDDGFFFFVLFYKIIFAPLNCITTARNARPSKERRAKRLRKKKNVQTRQKKINAEIYSRNRHSNNARDTKTRKYS